MYDFICTRHLSTSALSPGMQCAYHTLFLDRLSLTSCCSVNQYFTTKRHKLSHPGQEIAQIKCTHQPQSKHMQHHCYKEWDKQRMAGLHKRVDM